MTQSIGQQLASKREDLKQDQQYVSDKLNIRKSYIQAIEDDNYSVLPGKAYVSGFIKSYAEYLGLNPEDFLMMLKATQDLQEDYQNMPKQLYKDFNRTKNIFMLSLVILIISTISFSYYLFVQHQINIRKIDQKDTKSETLKTFFNESQDIAFVEKESDLIAEEPIAKEDVIELYGQKSKPPFARVLLKATDDVWIQVRPLHKKRVYVSKTIPKGKYYWLTEWDNVVLDVSDASRVELIIDDVNKGIIGSSSKKIRGLFLDVMSLNNYFKNEDNKTNDSIENYYKEAEKKPDAKVKEVKNQ